MKINSRYLIREIKVVHTFIAFIYPVYTVYGYA